MPRSKRRKIIWIPLIFPSEKYLASCNCNLQRGPRSNFFIRLSTYTHFFPPAAHHYDIASRLSCHNMWKGIQEPSIAGKTTTLQQQSTKGRLHYMGSEEESSIIKVDFFLCPWVTKKREEGYNNAFLFFASMHHVGPQRCNLSNRLRSEE